MAAAKDVRMLTYVCVLLAVFSIGSAELSVCTSDGDCEPTYGACTNTSWLPECSCKVPSFGDGKTVCYQRSSDVVKDISEQLSFIKPALENSPALVPTLLWTFLSIYSDKTKLGKWMECENRYQMCAGSLSDFKKLVSTPADGTTVDMSVMKSIMCNIADTKLEMLFKDLRETTPLTSYIHNLLSNMNTLTVSELQDIGTKMKDFIMKLIAFISDKKGFFTNLGIDEKLFLDGEKWKPVDTFVKELEKVMVPFGDLVNGTVLKEWVRAQSNMLIKLYLSKMSDVVRHATTMCQKINGLVSGNPFIVMKRSKEMAKIMTMMDDLPEIVGAFINTALAPEKMHNMAHTVLSKFATSDLCSDTTMLNAYFDFVGENKMESMMKTMCSVNLRRLMEESGLNLPIKAFWEFFMTPDFAYNKEVDADTLFENIQNIVKSATVTGGNIGKVAEKFERGEYVYPRWLNESSWNHILERLGPVLENLAMKNITDHIKDNMRFVQLFIPDDQTGIRDILSLFKDLLTLVSEVTKALGKSLNELSSMFSATTEMKKVVDLMINLPYVFEHFAKVIVNMEKFNKLTLALGSNTDYCQIPEIQDNPFILFLCGADKVDMTELLEELRVDNKDISQALYMMIRYFTEQTSPYTKNVDGAALYQTMKNVVDNMENLLTVFPQRLSEVQPNVPAWLNETVWQTAISNIGQELQNSMPANPYDYFNYIKYTFQGLRWSLLDGITAWVANIFKEIEKIVLAVIQFIDSYIESFTSRGPNIVCPLKLELQSNGKWLLGDKEFPHKMVNRQGKWYVLMQMQEFVMGAREVRMPRKHREIPVGRFLKYHTLDAAGNLAHNVKCKPTMDACVGQPIATLCPNGGTGLGPCLKSMFADNHKYSSIKLSTQDAWKDEMVNDNSQSHIDLCTKIKGELLNKFAQFDVWLFGEECSMSMRSSVPTQSRKKRTVNVPTLTDVTVDVVSADAKAENDLKGLLGSDATLTPGLESCLDASGNWARKDCKGICGGTAIRDNCGDCVGGTTGLDKGSKMKCGLCTSQAGYKDPADCNGDCFGTAVRVCGMCVGGLTGKALDAADHLKDCNGQCFGQLELDSCNKCGRKVDRNLFPLGSRFMDCSQTCHNTLDRQGYAIESCGECVGGNTNRALNYKKDLCGVCNGDDSTCKDCAGVIKGTSKVDACGVCGGDSSTCTNIVKVTPSLATNAKTDFMIDGAGCGADFVTVVFKPASGDPVRKANILPENGGTRVTVTSVTLPAGTYSISIEKATSEIIHPKGNVTLQIYDPTAIKFALSPTEFDLPVNARRTEITLVLTAAGGAKLPTEGCGSDVNTQTYPAEAGSTDASVTCKITLQKSIKFKVFLTLNGMIVGDGVDFTAFRAAPTLSSVRMSSCGFPLRASFDVNIETTVPASETAKYCYNYVDQATATKLGDKAVCSLKNGKHLTITPASSTNTLPAIEIGDTLVLKPNVIHAMGEAHGRYSAGHVNVTAPSNPGTAAVWIFGTSSVSNCANDKFLLKSIAQCMGGRGRFNWKVTSADNSSTTNIQNELNGKTGKTIQLSGSNLDVGRTYTFTLEATSVVGQKATATHTVVRESEAEPSIKDIQSSIDSSQVTVKNRFFIGTKLHFPRCAQKKEITFEWSADDASVQINEETRNKQTLKVNPGDIPAGISTVKYTQTMTKKSNLNFLRTKDITITMKSSDIIAKIKGGSKIQVGTGQGVQTLRGFAKDPDDTNAKIDYQWSCDQLNENGEVIGLGYYTDGTTRLSGTETTLSVDTSKIDVGNYKCYFEARVGTRSKTDTVDVEVVAGDPPKLTFADGYVLKLAAHDVRLTLEVESKAELQISDVNVVSMLSDGFGIIGSDFLKIESKGKRKVAGVFRQRFIITLEAAGLVEGSKYLIDVTASSGGGTTGSAQAVVETRPGVTGCRLTLSTTTVNVLDEITITVDDCVSTESQITYTYGICRNSDCTKRRRGSSLTTDNIKSNLVEKPATGNTITIFVRACDSYKSCLVTVSTSVTVDATKKHTAKEVDDLIESTVGYQEAEGDYSSAMVSVKTIIEVTSSSSRRRRAVDDSVAPSNSSSLSTTSLRLIGLSIEGGTYTEEDIYVAIDLMSSMDLAQTSATDQQSMISYLSSYMAALATGSGIDSEYSGKMLTLLGDLRKYTGNSKTDIEAVEKLLGKAQIVGSSDSSTDIENISQRETMRTTFSTLNGLVNTTADGLAALVDFGTELSAKYWDWDCLGDGSTNCYGVAATSRHFATGVDDVSTNADDKDNVASDLLELTLSNPKTGEELVVNNLVTPIKVTMKLTRTPVVTGDIEFLCKYWDDISAAWSITGLTTAHLGGDRVECSSQHLSLFAVIASPVQTTAAPTTTSSTVATTTKAAGDGNSDQMLYIIIGAVVGGVLLLAIVIVVVCVVIRKKSSKERADDHHKLAHARGTTSTAGGRSSASNRVHASPTPVETAEDNV